MAMMTSLTPHTSTPLNVLNFLLQLFLSFGSHPENMDKENDTTLPDYLPDEEDIVVDDKALARDKTHTRSGGWLSTAANFLTNSFYWW